MGSGNSGFFKNTKGALKPEHLLYELIKSDVKFNKEDVLMITKAKNNKIVWLEKGNNLSGLQHIINRHGNQFLAKGITKEDLPVFLKTTIENGKIIGKQGKFNSQPRIIYEVNYNGKVVKVVITISDNGYIVGANPK